jgi:hypothetical protein
LDIWQTGNLALRSQKKSHASEPVPRVAVMSRIWGIADMVTATLPAGFGARGLIAAAAVCAVLVVAHREFSNSKSQVAFRAQSTVAESAAPTLARLTPPWRSRRVPSYPMDWRLGQHTPFSYAALYNGTAREPAENSAAPAWAIVYEAHRPPRRHSRNK